MKSFRTSILFLFFREHYGVYNLTQKQQEKFLHMYEVLKD